jgi:oxygen-dependent protoporphyrinogen oxidase
VSVVVVGGGITGLAAAYALGKEGVPTLLLEASDRLGGKVRTETVDGFVIEHGPDSFVSYRPAAVRLAGELGLGDAIVRPQDPRIVFVRARDRFMRFPDGMGLVLPTKFRPFVTSNLFSWPEKARMALDLVLPRDGRDGDVAVGPFIRRRLGKAMVDRLAGPLIGGVYGTDIDELSVAAVVPQLREYERKHRSLLLASLAEVRERAAAAKAASAAAAATTGTVQAVGGSSRSPFVTLAGGTGQLVETLARTVRSLPGVEVRTGVRVHSLSLEIDGPRAGVRLEGGEFVCADAVILATPAPTTATLLDDVAPDAAKHLRTIEHGSTAVVNLAYRDEQVPDDVVGHGFLVAEDEPLTIGACTLSSRKWAGRAPDGTLLIRAFIGSTRSEGHRLPDARLVAAAHADIARLLGISGAPILSRVARYPGAMPHYTVGHLDRVAAAEAALAPFPALRIAGGAYRGVGLPDCIAQGRAAADAVLARLGGRMEPETDEAGTYGPLASRATAPSAA